jgi:hypothetical protein
MSAGEVLQRQDVKIYYLFVPTNAVSLHHLQGVLNIGFVKVMKLK